jgi:hypothetical protein
MGGSYFTFFATGFGVQSVKGGSYFIFISVVFGVWQRPVDPRRFGKEL